MASYRIEIPGWIPVSLNKITGHWGRRTGLKAKDARAIERACTLAGVPTVGVPLKERRKRKALKLPAKLPTDPEPVRRRVSLEITWPKGKRSSDPDNLFKTLCDGLKRGGFLFDDNIRWCEAVMPPAYFRGGEGEAETVIVLEDTEMLPAMPKRPNTKGRRAS